MAGRPSEFSDELAERICDRIANGESLRAICSEAGMPDARTVHRWVSDNEAFRQQYARARDAQADTLAEEILEIADDTSGDLKLTKDGGVEGDSTAVNRARLRVDARKWFAGKVAPKKYGDRQQVEMKHEASDAFLQALRLMQGKGNAVA